MIIPSHSFGVVASGRPRAAVATGFGAGDLAFNDITTTNVSTIYGNIVTATKSGTIYISSTPSLNAEHYVQFTINGVLQSIFQPLNSSVVYGGETASVSISAGNTLQWYGSQTSAPVGADSFTITIRNSNSTGTIIDTITVNNTDLAPP